MPNASQGLFQNCAERPAAEVRVSSSGSLCVPLEASATVVTAAAVRPIRSSNFATLDLEKPISETTNCKGYVRRPWQVRPRATESSLCIAPEQAERRGVVVPPPHGLRGCLLLPETSVPVASRNSRAWRFQKRSCDRMVLVQCLPRSLTGLENLVRSNSARTGPRTGGLKNLVRWNCPRTGGSSHHLSTSLKQGNGCAAFRAHRHALHSTPEHSPVKHSRLASSLENLRLCGTGDRSDENTHTVTQSYRRRPLSSKITLHLAVDEGGEGPGTVGV